MHFTKWHGCGNDYVFVNGFEENFDDVYSKIVAISDRHFGVGSDGVDLPPAFGQGRYSYAYVQQ